MFPKYEIYSCYHVYNLRYTLCLIYLRLMAAIFDFSVLFCSAMLSGPENMDNAFEISLLFCAYITFREPLSWISDYRLHLTVFLLITSLINLTRKHGVAA